MSPTVTTKKIVSSAARVSNASRANSYPVIPKRKSRRRLAARPRAPSPFPLPVGPSIVRLQPIMAPASAHRSGSGSPLSSALLPALRSPPRFELEIGDASGWTGSERIGRLDEDAWAAADWQVPGLRVFHATGGSSPEAVRPILHRLTEASGGVWRLSVRREPPHVEV